MITEFHIKLDIPQFKRIELNESRRPGLLKVVLFAIFIPYLSRDSHVRHKVVAEHDLTRAE